MARRSRMSILKRQRELRKAEKAARKRARRHGRVEQGSLEPVPTLAAVELFGLRPREEQGDSEPAEPSENQEEEPG